MRCLIYVMRGIDTGLLKIGHSWNPSARLRSVAATIEAVELVAAFEAPEAMEYELHRRFAAHLAADRGREWFRCEGAIAEWLATLPGEHRRNGSYRVRRRAPHLSPENAAAMRGYMRRRKSPSESRASQDFYKAHGHPFVPGAYVEGCVECWMLRTDGVAPPATASEALTATARAA